MLQEERLEHEQVIEGWMLTVSQDGGIERFDDLHIDRIDETWRSKQLWVEGGLDFRIAMRLRDRHKLRVEVVLGFSLQADDKRIGINFKTREEFAKWLDWTPPSLYLFEARIEHGLENERAIREGHLYDDAVVEELNLNLFGTLEQGQRYFYMEFRRKEEAQYCRSVFLRG
jgi:hypothetical protein